MINIIFKSISQSINNFCKPPSKIEESAVRTWQAVGLSPSPFMRITAFFLSIVPITLSALGIFGHPIVSSRKAMVQVMSGNYRKAPAEWLQGLKQSARSMAQVPLLASTAIWGFFFRRFYEVLIEPENVTIQKNYDRLLTEKDSKETTLNEKINRIESLENELKKQIKLLEEKEANILTLKSSLQDKEKILDANSDCQTTLKEQIETLKQELQNKKNSSTNTKETELLQQSLNDKDQLLKSNGKNEEALNEKIGSLSELLIKKSQELNELQLNYENVLKEKETLKSELDSKISLLSNDEKATKITELTNELSELKETNTYLENYKIREEELKKTKEDNNQKLKEQLITLQGDLDTVKENHQEAKTEIQELKQNNNSLKIEVKEAEQKIEGLKKENDDYLKGLFKLEQENKDDSPPTTPPSKKKGTPSSSGKYSSVRVKPNRRNSQKINDLKLVFEPNGDHFDGTSSQTNDSTQNKEEKDDSE